MLFRSKQVDVEGSTVHRERHLATYKGETAAQLVVLLIIWHTFCKLSGTLLRADEVSAIPHASREIALQRLELLRRLLTQIER